MKSIIVMLAEGFEEIEALTVVDVMRRAGVKCNMCSLKGKQVTGSHGIKVEADTDLNSSELVSYDGIVLPGGMPGAENLKNNLQVVELVKEYYSNGKIVAAICAAPIVLEKAGIIRGKKITSFPDFKEKLDNSIYNEDMVVEDENIITSRGPATALPFSYAILKKLGLNEEAENLYNSMLFNIVTE
ncbi:DJ-1 family glyoxalase III [Clostridium polynesiense]|uniref:DJ-1 family glyoxalase III n=1 Tax=Clostridium polynesiense TaxID=1325933 RepID=UPI00058EC900|nr:DJ-1 family glyoxalase III [Clostridium polynesiense]